MNLTVGPLPPAVYWRRRALVLAVVLGIVVVFVAMCSHGAAPSSGRVADVHGGTGPSPIVLAPIIGGTGASSTGSSATPAASTPMAPAGNGGTGASADCTDAEIQLTPVATLNADGTYTLTLKVRNISSRTCSRDVGADPQELHVVQNGQTVWSSDSCQAVHGVPDVRSFGPNIEATFSIVWDGSTGTGCTNGTKIVGGFQVVAKLGTKVSAPVSYPGATGK